MILSSSRSNPWQRAVFFLFLIGLGLLLLAIISKSILYFIGYPVDDLSELMHDLEKNTVLARTLVIIQHVILFIMVPLVFVRLTNAKIQDYWLFSWPGWRSLIIFFGFLLIMYPLISVFSIWASMVAWPDWLNSMDKSYTESLQTILLHDTIGDQILTLIIVAVLPGIGEELFFRGVIQKELMSMVKNPHLAIWITAIVFSLLHFQATGFPAKCLIGVALGYAYYHTSTLLIPMILHTFNNTAAALALFSSQESFSDERPIPDFDWMQLGLVAVFIYFSVLYYHNFIKKGFPYDHG